MTKNVNKTNPFILIEKLKENNLEVFTTRDIELITGKKPYNTIKALKKKELIEKIKNGVYAIKGTDEMKTATRAIEPSYISFLTALNYYGYTDQAPRKITLATTKRKKHKNYDFSTIKKSFFFGYTNINGIIIAEKEKALLDSLYNPKQALGIRHVKQAIKNAWKDINKEKLHEYAEKNKTTKKKLKKIIK